MREPVASAQEATGRQDVKSAKFAGAVQRYFE
jgi:hypothetical protein